MEAKTLNRLLLVLAAIGVLTFFYFAQISLATPVNIGDLKDSVGRTVRVDGEVSYVNVLKEGHVFFGLRDKTGKITVVSFAGAGIKESYDLIEGQSVSIIGKVQKYKGKLEVVAKNIAISET